MRCYEETIFFLGVLLVVIPCNLIGQSVKSQIIKSELAGTSDIAEISKTDNYIHLLYDDGTAENFAAWQFAGNMNAVKFHSPNWYPLVVFGAALYVGEGTFPPGGTILGQPFAISVYLADGEGGMPGTLVDSVNSSLINMGWVTVVGLNVTIYSDFYIVMTQLSNVPDCVPIGVDETLPKAYKSYSRNVLTSNPWVLWPYQDFMIHALVGTNVGDRELSKDDIEISPNPTSDYFKIVSGKAIKFIKIYSVSGVLIHDFQNLDELELNFNLREYVNGLYILRVGFSDGETMLRKLVINQ